MRLHRLELSAFLAFPGREVVDFDDLGEAGLFLLHGTHGRGQDARCWTPCASRSTARSRARAGRRAAAVRPRAAGARTEVVLEATLPAAASG